MIRSIKNLVHLLIAWAAAVYYKWPGKKMTVVGVTGTDGKTTTAHLIYEILKLAGKNVSMISTISAVINNESYDTGFHVTTPSPWVLQKFMRLAVNGSSKYFVLEVTSHGLDQHRIYGTSIDMGVITTISHEHLDYHGSLKKYRETKAKLLKGVKYSVLNKDDESYKFVKNRASGKVVTYAIDQSADYTPKKIKLKPSLIGKYNLYNCLAAATVGFLLNIDKKIIYKAIAEFKGIPGRMEKVKNKKGFKVYIDFAHKPNALRQVLKTAGTLTERKVIVIFGCAGLRDRLKRPMMGEIAATLSDYVILTAEDPRTEDVRRIIEEIAQGCFKKNISEASKKDKKMAFLKKGEKYFWRIPDRQEAINFAVRYLAKKSDLVLICGKGHERSLCYGKIEYPWNERRAVKKALSYGSI